MTHEEQQARIEAIYARWRPVLGLDEWEVRRDYHDGHFVTNDDEVSGEALASTSVQWEYRRAQIAWNTRFAEESDDDGLEYAVVHEAMHILLNGQRAMRERGDTVGREYERLFEEHTATTLAWAFIRAKEMAQ